MPDGSSGCSRRLLLLGHVVSPAERWPSGAVAVEGPRISAVGAREQVTAALGEDRAGWTVLDYGDAWLIPGMIDLHIHGGRGADVMMAEPAGLAAVARVAAEGGATGFLATTRTARREDLVAVARGVGEAAREPVNGARGAGILGLHLEGPYISRRRTGGQPPQHIRRPDPEELEDIARAAGGQLRMVTFAPEEPGGIELARWLTGRGIIPSLGHSNATYEQAVEAIQSGVTHFTHAYNAMAPLHHREPGALTAGLLDQRVTLQVIADGLHVHPAALRLAYRCKGPGGIALVSDSTGAGLPPGRFRVCGRELVVDDQAVRLSDGTLAGSKLQLNRALQVCVEQAGIPLPDAVRMAATTPARILGLSGRKGALAPGYDADVVVLARDFSVAAVLIAGRFVVGGPQRTSSGERLMLT